MDVMISTLATLMIGAAFLLTALVALSTGFFQGRVPTGPDAMAILGPVIAGAVSWVLMLAAAWICIGRGGFVWVADDWRAWLTVTLVVVGMAMAAAGGFWGWAERMGPSPWLTGLAGTMIVPMLAQVILAFSAWGDPQWLSGTKMTFAILAAGGVCLADALAGYGVGAYALNAYVGRQAEAAERETEEAMARARERARRDALSESQRVAEDLAQLPPATPFWNVSMMLIDQKDPVARRMIVERARRVPDFETELKSTAECSYVSLRGGAVEFILRCEDRDPAWSEIVGKAMDLLTVEIVKRGELDGDRRDEDLSAEAERALSAAEKFPGAGLERRAAALVAAVEASRPSAKRTRVLNTMGIGDAGSP